MEVLGFSGTPNVGDEIVVMDTERSAKKLSEERQDERRKEKLQIPKRANLESFFGSMGDGKKLLKVVLKGDVQGSVEAILGALREIKSEKIDLEVIHSAAGAITESDILAGERFGCDCDRVQHEGGGEGGAGGASRRACR